ncbi:DUF6049 family protein [Microbacterium sp. H1-D42]|uniref:DUF6049 family protein n=1 Tax=Microbacterium sp. H1-D42 TaxID=2925844 RepID=UPI001F533A1C|nr:DUF6049 family protein [Microbacterium sp. H1-D42]UNK70903.1 DUF6049 family protein [Microbacterium sp. H1-D42]
MTSTHPREASRPRARRLLSRLAAVVVVGSLALGGASAASADENSDAPEPGDTTVELFVSTGSGTAIEPGGPLVSTVTLENGADTDLSAGTVTVQVSRSPLADSAALNSWLGDGVVSDTFHTVASEPTPVVDDGAKAAVNVVVDAVDLGDLSPGVYPVKARLSGASTTGPDGETVPWDLTSTTVLVVSAPGEHTSAVLVPITATPENGSLLTADELATLTAGGGALAGLLDAVTGTTAILAVDPAIPAAIRMLGARAPETAKAWLTELERLPNDVFALQFGDADATVQAAAGLTSLLATPDLAPLIQPEDFPSAADPTPTPDSTPSADPEPTLPDNSELTAILGAHSGVLWPRPEVTEQNLSSFATYLGDTVTTILPSTSFTGAAAAHSTTNGHDVLVVDAAASARLSAAVELDDPAAADRELTAAAGHQFFASQRSTTTILGLDRSETRSPAAVRAALSAFASPASSLAQLRSVKATSAELTSVGTNPRVDSLNRLLSDEQRLTDFSTILEEPALLLNPTRVRVLRTIGVGLDDTEFAAATTAQAERVQETLNAVGIQQPKAVQLFTSAAPLPVWVRNDLPWDVHVSLYSTPSDVRLDIQPVTQVTAQAAGSTRVNIPIEARVASGNVDVTFRLSSPTGVPIGQPAVADVTLRADWEAIGLGILAGLIGLLLVFGIVRTVRRRKSDAAAAAAASDDAATSDQERDE